MKKFRKFEFAKTRVTQSAQNGEIHKTEEPLVIRKTPVFWGIPCDELSFSRFWIVYERNSNRMPWDGFAASEGTYLPKARNIIHKAFLEDTNLPYLMMLDSDILFPPHLVETLMAHNLPIVGGWYKDKKEFHPAVYDYVSQDDSGVNYFRHRDEPGIGLEKVDAMGAGCWLMKREVAEALGSEPYDMNHGGEDMKLSKKLMDLGIPLHVDWSINCAHVKVGHV